MKEKNKIILIISLLLIVVIALIVYLITDNKYSADEHKFYKEYNIEKKDNNVEYIDAKSLKLKLVRDSSIIFVGNSKKTNVNLLNKLISSIKEYDTILYYYDSTNISVTLLDYISEKLEQKLNNANFLVIFVKDGKIESYYNYDINKKLSNKDLVANENYFLNHIHNVKSDVCEKDEQC